MQNVWLQYLDVSVELGLGGDQSIYTCGFKKRTKTKAPCDFSTKDHKIGKRFSTGLSQL